MEKKDKVFAKGFNFKRSENAPEWVVGKLSIKLEDAMPFLTQNQSGDWVNLSIARGQQGNYYIELDTWKPTGQASTPAQAPVQKDTTNDLPWD
jgi:hypothetical protein